MSQHFFLSAVVAKGSDAVRVSQHFFPFSSCCKTGKNMFFNIPFKSSSVAGEVWNQTLANFLPTFVSNIATFKKKTLMTQTLQFFSFSAVVAKLGKNMFFNIPFKSSSVAGEVWNQTLANFFCQHVSATSQLFRKTLMTQTLQFFSFSAVVAKQWAKTCFQHPLRK